MLPRWINARHARALRKHASELAPAGQEIKASIHARQTAGFSSTVAVSALDEPLISKYDEQHNQNENEPVQDDTGEHGTSELFNMDYDSPGDATSRLTNEHGLPLPPFMRPARKSSRFQELGLAGQAYTPGNDKTLQEKRRQAPFATALAQNPYAHALAVPGRECSFTHARLPRSCLIDLHLREDKAGGKIELLPLSLAAQMVPKKKPDHRLTEEQRAATKAWDAEGHSNVPLGSSTYIVARKEALDFISADTKKRLRRYAVGRRVNETVGKYGRNNDLSWRQDMGDFVLDSMRKVLFRRLRYWFNGKGASPDKPGIIAQLPGNAGLERLDDAENVSCVLRLTPSDPNLKLVQPEKTEAPWANDVPKSAPQARSKPLREEKPRSNKDGEVLVGSETHSPKSGYWTSSEDKLLPFLTDTHPLAPPDQALTLYFPTVRYRNRRVPIYCLPDLLGDEMTDKLVQNTALRDSVYVTFASSASSVQPQMLLLKLHAYLAGTKAEATKL